MASAPVRARRAGPVGTITIPRKDAESKIKVKRFGIGESASVEFVNATGGNVKLWIPNGGALFVQPGGVPSPDIRIDVPAADRLSLAVKERPADGLYPYSAYCEDIGGFAEGNSAPIIACP
jgi:hypothetical protein